MCTRFATAALFAGLLLPAATAHAWQPGEPHPVLGSSRHQLGFSYIEAENAVRGISLEYAQPNHFFRLPGKRSFYVGSLNNMVSEKKNYGETLQALNYIALQQSAYLGWQKLYLGGSFGASYFGDHTTRFDSAFTFNQRVFIGSNFNRFGIEGTWQHFSNGGLTDRNPGINLYGVTLNMNF